MTCTSMSPRCLQKGRKSISFLCLWQTRVESLIGWQACSPGEVCPPASVLLLTAAFAWSVVLRLKRLLMICLCRRQYRLLGSWLEH